MDRSRTAEPRSVDLLKEFLDSCATHEGRGSAESIDLAELWRDLVAGQYRVEDVFHSEHRCYLALLAGGGDPIASRRNVQILEDWLTRGSQKSVALERGLSYSTVAATARHCLMQMGLECAPRRVPAILVMAAKAASGTAFEADARVSLLHEAERSHWIVSVHRLDDRLSEELTPAESYVVRAVVEGRGHAEIARARGCSPRTVANQLAAAFQRLHVSGRAELMSLLIDRCAREHAPEPPPIERPFPRSTRRLRAARPWGRSSLL